MKLFICSGWQNVKESASTGANFMVKEIDEVLPDWASPTATDYTQARAETAWELIENVCKAAGIDPQELTWGIGDF